VFGVDGEEGWRDHFVAVLDLKPEAVLKEGGCSWWGVGEKCDGCCCFRMERLYLWRFSFRSQSYLIV